EEAPRRLAVQADDDRSAGRAGVDVPDPQRAAAIAGRHLDVRRFEVEIGQVGEAAVRSAQDVHGADTASEPGRARRRSYGAWTRGRRPRSSTPLAAATRGR